MKHYVKRVEEHLHLDTVDCDRCGQSMRDSHCQNIEGMVTTVTGGYASPIIGDMETWHFDVCEKCLEEWGQSFKVKPWEAGELDVGQRARASIQEVADPEQDPEMLEVTGEIVASLEKATARENHVREAYARAKKVSDNLPMTKEGIYIKEDLPSWSELTLSTRNLWRMCYSMAISDHKPSDTPLVDAMYRAFVDAARELEASHPAQVPTSEAPLVPTEDKEPEYHEFVKLVEASEDVLKVTDAVTEVKVTPAESGFAVHTPGLSRNSRKPTKH